eukprot:gene6677-biopygen7417
MLHHGGGSPPWWGPPPRRVPFFWWGLPPWWTPSRPPRWGPHHSGQQWCHQRRLPADGAGRGRGGTVAEAALAPRQSEKRQRTRAGRGPHRRIQRYGRAPDADRTRRFSHAPRQEPVVRGGGPPQPAPPPQQQQRQRCAPPAPPLRCATVIGLYQCPQWPRAACRAVQAGCAAGQLCSAFALELASDGAHPQQPC